MDTKIQLRNSVVFYRSFFEAIRELQPADQTTLYNAVFEYSFNLKEPENITGLCRAVWTLIKPQIDANIRKFENGKKPKKKSKTEANDKQDESKQEANPMLMRNDNVNENVNGNEEGGIGKNSPPPSQSIQLNTPPPELISDNRPPTAHEVRQFFDAEGYTEDAANRMFAAYDWTVFPFKSTVNGSTFKDWQAKARKQWFKEEDKKPKKKISNGGIIV